MELRDIIRRAIEISNKAGFITFDQLNEISPANLEPEDIEALMGALSDAGIQVMDETSSTSGPPCSFCGKPQTDVLQLVAGPDALICNECVQLCVRIISTNHPEWLAEHKKFVDGLGGKSD